MANSQIRNTKQPSLLVPTWALCQVFLPTQGILILTIILHGRSQGPHFTDKKTETPRNNLSNRHTSGKQLCRDQNTAMSDTTIQILSIMLRGLRYKTGKLS